jgi:hypothetical protein|tara:strand:- start:2343 stop:2591 length:249 start_codon:yes stop_codon:yes gene_type:complete
LHHNEGPSQEDIERFSTHETGYCPHCGEEIWDDIQQCPSCNTWLQGGTVHQNPIHRAFKQKALALIILIILIGFFWSLIRFF